ncbi:hypothetical protein PAEH1_02870 [Paenalcaligenes hominis]|uniref:Uncharacterized protein n=1 Tax=Paenalcaligenes hominis TaxID=643674 RepID=A0A1U9JY96_9BURK|nr:hypothetical protein [Paenalcaligenes hominis]AQS50765.1 hypothetical protein PAEH1_02870 [Paenalcaligenes hominis]
MNKFDRILSDPQLILLASIANPFLHADSNGDFYISETGQNVDFDDVMALLRKIEQATVKAFKDRLAKQESAITHDAPPQKHIQKLLSIHEQMLIGNSYTYFELAYTRQTGWMVWICSHPLETHPNRVVITKGQGGTPDEACAAALTPLKIKALSNGTFADKDTKDHKPDSIPQPLYLVPTLPIEPSDELIAEIKAMADIRLVDGRVELSNVKEIIHAIVHHPIYAN